MRSRHVTRWWAAALVCAAAVTGGAAAKETVAPTAPAVAVGAGPDGDATGGGDRPELADCRLSFRSSGWLLSVSELDEGPQRGRETAIWPSGLTSDSSDHRCTCLLGQNSVSTDVPLGSAPEISAHDKNSHRNAFHSPHSMATYRTQVSSGRRTNSKPYSTTYFPVPSPSVVCA